MAAVAAELMDNSGLSSGIEPLSVLSAEGGAFAFTNSGSGEGPCNKVVARARELGCKTGAPLPGRNRCDGMGICIICKLECSDSFPATMLCLVSASTVKVRSGKYVDRMVWVGLIVVDLYRGVRAAVTPAGKAEHRLRRIALGGPEDLPTSGYH